MLNPVPLTVELADNVVNAPVLAVVAPTVPLMLIDAVPVRLVTVPELGVPNAPPEYKTVPPVPNATELASVPVNVKVLLTVNVLPSATVNVAEVAGAVMANLLMLVAEATPNIGVVSVGDVANTTLPLPVVDAELAAVIRPCASTVMLALV